MTIAEIKQNLSIEQVLTHYGIQVKGKHCRCPFHEDKTPSMQVYPNTGTVHCFSGNCEHTGKAIDVIDFIQYKEELSKKEVIEKAKQLAGLSSGVSTQEGYVSEITRVPNQTPPVSLSRIAVLTKLMSQAKESLKKSPRAKAYCEKRGLDPDKLPNMGYLNDRFYQNWNEKLKETAAEIGILTKRSNGQYSSNFKDSLVFGLKNKEGKVVGLYGRSLEGKHHRYLKGSHQGLYPKWPSREARQLILTESVIDAASLIQHTEYPTLALYGTSGLTPDHTEAVSQLENLEEVILFYDGDEAGKKAAQKHAEQLKVLLPEIKIRVVDTPENEDPNSLAVNHPGQEPEILHHLIDKRVPFYLPNTSYLIPDTSKNTLDLILDTSNPEKITYQDNTLTIEIWGGIEYSNLHRLKLTLTLTNNQNETTFRDEVNLYSHRSRKGFIQAAAEELELPQTEIKQTVEQFTKEVEQYRIHQREQYKQQQESKIPKLSEAERKAAINQLKSSNLINYLQASMQKIGLIGEAENGLLLFLIFLTRHFDHPLHALVHGSSGSGKTNLLKTILKLVPEESKHTTTALTENVLFRPPTKDYWKHKILLLEDLDGSYKALYPLRELMSNQYISKISADPNPKTGKHEQVLLEAEGPIVIAGATTRDKIYEDNSNRSFLLHVDESKQHQERILDYQNRRAAGLINPSGTEKIIKKIHDLQRALDPTIRIINPFQPELKLPEYIFKKLRTNTHYITLIKAITFIHQMQRTRKTDSNGNKTIQTTLEDVALANSLSKQSLLRKSDELSGEVRSFFESLKHEIKQKEANHFTAKEIRERFRMHPMKLKRRLDELSERGYIRKTGGNRRTSYEYEVATWDDYKVLQKGLEILDETLEKLWQKYPNGIFTQANEDVSQ